MATLAEAPARSPSAKPVDEIEAALRVDLAACYRLVALFGWDDLVATHLSVRLPDNQSFLINPFGKLFNELTPALVRERAVFFHVFERVPPFLQASP